MFNQVFNTFNIIFGTNAVQTDNEIADTKEFSKSESKRPRQLTADSATMRQESLLEPRRKRGRPPRTSSFADEEDGILSAQVDAAVEAAAAAVSTGGGCGGSSRIHRGKNSTMEQVGKGNVVQYSRYRGPSIDTSIESVCRPALSSLGSATPHGFRDDGLLAAQLSTASTRRSTRKMKAIDISKPLVVLFPTDNPAEKLSISETEWEDFHENMAAIPLTELELESSGFTATDIIAMNEAMNFYGNQSSSSSALAFATTDTSSTPTERKIKKQAEIKGRGSTAETCSEQRKGLDGNMTDSYHQENARLVVYTPWVKPYVDTTGFQLSSPLLVPSKADWDAAKRQLEIGVEAAASAALKANERALAMAQQQQYHYQQNASEGASSSNGTASSRRPVGRPRRALEVETPSTYSGIEMPKPILQSLLLATDGLVKEETNEEENADEKSLTTLKAQRSEGGYCFAVASAGAFSVSNQTIVTSSSSGSSTSSSSSGTGNGRGLCLAPVSAGQLLEWEAMRATSVDYLANLYTDYDADADDAKLVRDVVATCEATSMNINGGLAQLRTVHGFKFAENAWTGSTFPHLLTVHCFEIMVSTLERELQLIQDCRAAQQRSASVTRDLLSACREGKYVNHFTRTFLNAHKKSLNGSATVFVGNDSASSGSTSAAASGNAKRKGNMGKTQSPQQSNSSSHDINSSKSSGCGHERFSREQEEDMYSNLLRVVFGSSSSAVQIDEQLGRNALEEKICDSVIKLRESSSNLSAEVDAFLGGASDLAISRCLGRNGGGGCVKSSKPTRKSAMICSILPTNNMDESVGCINPTGSAAGVTVSAATPRYKKRRRGRPPASLAAAIVREHKGSTHNNDHDHQHRDQLAGVFPAVVNNEAKVTDDSVGIRISTNRGLSRGVGSADATTAGSAPSKKAHSPRKPFDHRPPQYSVQELEEIVGEDRSSELLCRVLFLYHSFAARAMEGENKRRIIAAGAAAAMAAATNVQMQVKSEDAQWNVTAGVVSSSSSSSPSSLSSGAIIATATAAAVAAAASAARKGGTSGSCSSGNLPTGSSSSSSNSEESAPHWYQVEDPMESYALLIDSEHAWMYASAERRASIEEITKRVYRYWLQKRSRVRSSLVRSYHSFMMDQWQKQENTRVPITDEYCADSFSYALSQLRKLRERAVSERTAAGNDLIRDKNMHAAVIRTALELDQHCAARFPGDRKDTHEELDAVREDADAVANSVGNIASTKGRKGRAGRPPKSTSSASSRRRGQVARAGTGNSICAADSTSYRLELGAPPSFCSAMVKSAAIPAGDGQSDGGGSQLQLRESSTSKSLVRSKSGRFLPRSALDSNTGSSVGVGFDTVLGANPYAGGSKVGAKRPKGDLEITGAPVADTSVCTDVVGKTGVNDSEEGVDGQGEGKDADLAEEDLLSVDEEYEASRDRLLTDARIARALGLSLEEEEEEKDDHRGGDSDVHGAATAGLGTPVCVSGSGSGSMTGRNGQRKTGARVAFPPPAASGSAGSESGSGVRRKSRSPSPALSESVPPPPPVQQHQLLSSSPSSTSYQKRGKGSGKQLQQQQQQQRHRRQQHTAGKSIKQKQYAHEEEEEDVEEQEEKEEEDDDDDNNDDNDDDDVDDDVDGVHEYEGEEEEEELSQDQSDSQRRERAQSVRGHSDGVRKSTKRRGKEVRDRSHESAGNTPRPQQQGRKRSISNVSTSSVSVTASVCSSVGNSSGDGPSFSSQTQKPKPKPKLQTQLQDQPQPRRRNLRKHSPPPPIDARARGSAKNAKSVRESVERIDRIHSASSSSSSEQEEEEEEEEEEESGMDRSDNEHSSQDRGREEEVQDMHGSELSDEDAECEEEEGALAEGVSDQDRTNSEEERSLKEEDVEGEGGVGTERHSRNGRNDSACARHVLVVSSSQQQKHTKQQQAQQQPSRRHESSARAFGQGDSNSGVTRSNVASSSRAPSPRVATQQAASLSSSRHSSGGTGIGGAPPKSNNFLVLRAKLGKQRPKTPNSSVSASNFPSTSGRNAHGAAAVSNASAVGSSGSLSQQRGSAVAHSNRSYAGSDVDNASSSVRHTSSSQGTAKSQARQDMRGVGRSAAKERNGVSAGAIADASTSKGASRTLPATSSDMRRDVGTEDAAQNRRASTVCHPVSASRLGSIPTTSSSSSSKGRDAGSSGSGGGAGGVALDGEDISHGNKKTKEKKKKPVPQCSLLTLPSPVDRLSIGKSKDSSSSSSSSSGRADGGAGATTRRAYSSNNTTSFSSSTVAVTRTKA